MFIFKHCSLPILLFFLTTVQPAFAHFGMVLPSTQAVNSQDEENITVDLMFWHPFENKGMNLERPTSFVAYQNGQKTDLTSKLQAAKIGNSQIWRTNYTVNKPGLLTLVMQPAPYFEEAEDLYIVHYTKAYVAAFGQDEGWDKPLGLKTEILPLTKPYALYADNLFQGIVLLDGKPVPNAEVEVEHYNARSNSSPNDFLTTQTIKADKNGVFSYAMPASGWWGFAALNEDSKTILRNNEPKKVELGAVLWLYAYPFEK